MSESVRRSDSCARGRIFGLLALVILVGAACADPAGPARNDTETGDRQESGLFSTGEWIGGSWSVHGSESGEPVVLLRRAGGAPLLESYEQTVVARHGERTVLRFRYASASHGDDDDDDVGGGSGRTFLKFELDALSLLSRPDGTPFLPGDEVQITVSLDPELLVATFEPSGLTFHPAHPAQLRMHYGWADPDTDGDGLEDLDESRIEIVGQEKPGHSWFGPEQARSQWSKKVDAWLSGFTRYSLGI